MAMFPDHVRGLEPGAHRGRGSRHAAGIPPLARSAPLPVGV